MVTVVEACAPEPPTGAHSTPAPTANAAAIRIRDGTLTLVLRLRGIFEHAGRRLAAIDDDDALGWSDDPDHDTAVDLTYDSVDGLLAWLPELDYEYRGDKRHTLDLPTAPRPTLLMGDLSSLRQVPRNRLRESSDIRAAT